MIELTGPVVQDRLMPIPEYCHAHWCLPARPAVAVALVSNDDVLFRAPLCEEHVAEVLAAHGEWRDLRSTAVAP